jgi:hypothetical protein
MLTSRANSPRMYVARLKIPPLDPHGVTPPTVRTKRVREARDEAKKEIETYKSAKEEEYKKFEKEVSHSPHVPSPLLSFDSICHPSPG